MVRYERLAFQLEAPVIGYVAEGSAAEQAGIREGDTIVAIDDEKMPTWEAYGSEKSRRLSVLLTLPSSGMGRNLLFLSQ